jgi:IS30 family transposase
MPQASYQRLSEEERESISRGLAAGQSFAVIARELNRSTSSISREVKGNYGRARYRAWPAGRKARKCMGRRRFGKSKLLANPRLCRYVEVRLRRRWSPDEIARRLAVDYPDDMSMRLSAEAIYQYIYVLPRGELKATLIKGLRQEHKYRRTRKSQAGKETDMRGKISDMLSIEERPIEVANRTVPGHWEGDLILGKNKRSALGTLVERVTRYTLLVALEAKDAHSVRKAYAQALQKLPRTLTLSLTYDQGKEMSGHRAFTVDTGITVYFAHPCSPWERGTNENTNGLVRQFFPKGTAFDKLPTGAVRKVQNLLNNRPRKVLNYKTPNEAFNALVALDY